MRTARSSEAESLIRPGLATTPVVIAVLVLVVIPIVDLLRTTVDAVANGEFEMSGGGASAIVNSLWTSTAATAGALVIGVAGALLTARGGTARRLRIGMLLALLVPPFVSALAWTRAFGPGGLTDDLFGWTLPGLIGPAGIVLVMAVHAAPLVYLVAEASLATRARPELEWAARASGAGKITTLRRVTLPLVGPAVAGGGALAFVVSVNSFGIPAVLGIPAGFPTITTRIYGDLARSAEPAAFARVVVLSTLLVFVVGAAVLVADRTLRRAVPAVPAAREPLHGRPQRRWTVAAAWTYVAITVGVPLLAVTLTSLTRAVGLTPWPGNWTLANFADAWSGGAWAAAARSLTLAAVAATLVTFLATLGVVRRKGRHSSGIAGITATTFAIPGSALAVAVLVAYGPWLRDTLLLILLAYLAKFWALAQRSVAGSAGALDRDVIDASRAAGATGPATVRRIVLPILRPALGAAWLLVFLFGLHELTMLSLLYGPGTATLAVVTLEVQQLGDVTVTAALAVLLTLPGMLAALLIVHRREART